MNATDIVIYGAGGLAREVSWILDLPGTRLLWQDGRRTSTIRVVGHLDDSIELHGETVNGRPVLGNFDWLSTHHGHAVIVAIGDPNVRKKIVSDLGPFGVPFPTVLAEGTIVGNHGRVGQGGIGFPGVVITSNVIIGDFVLLNPHVSISHDGQVGDYCSLGPGVSLAGNVHVGAGSDLGTNASVIPGVRIGEKTIVGAGACVTRDLPAGSTAVGVPAKVIKSSKQF